MPLVAKFKFKANTKNHDQRKELFNLRNVECQKKFKSLTDSTTKFSESIDVTNVENSSDKFLKVLNKTIHKSFKKVRITSKKKTNNNIIDKLMKERIEIKGKNDMKSKTRLEVIENELSELCAENNKKIIEKEIKGLTNTDGGLNTGRLWKLKKKLVPKYRDPPFAKKDEEGHLVTSVEKLKELCVRTYKDRLKHEEIKPSLKNYKLYEEELFQNRKSECEKVPLKPWTMAQLVEVLKGLKKEKCRDPLDLVNDIFHTDVAGKDMLKGLLKLLNQIKMNHVFPKVLRFADISTIYKGKGEKTDMNNDRGIFCLTILRTIFDKLLYNEKYETIDSNLTDSNVGARKSRNIRDNLFVVNAVINSAKQDKSKPIDIHVYDVTKCFDKLWLQKVLNDVYETGIHDSTINLLYEENAKNYISIRTPFGKTKQFEIDEIVMQGSVWGPIECTASMDKLGEIAYRTGKTLHTYKNEVQIPPLGMIDDVLAIAECGTQSVKTNTIINSFIDSKKLQLSSKKCHQIHIEKMNSFAQNLKLMDPEWRKWMRKPTWGIL